MDPALALLHSIAWRNLQAVRSALAAGAETVWNGIPALCVCSMLDWADPVPLLVAKGADPSAGVQLHDPPSRAPIAVEARLQAIGIPGDLCSAVLPLEENKTPLALAVRCGSAAAAAALVSAGARPAGAFRQLVELARWKAEQLGPQAAATAVPELVQQCAEALLAAPQAFSGAAGSAALVEAHSAAAQLALPSASPKDQTETGSYPACPWMLGQLLRHLHRGPVQLPAAEGGVCAVCDALLAHVAQRKQLKKLSKRRRSQLASTLAAWLRLPAASSIQDDRLAPIFQQVCQLNLAAALPPLLALAPMQALLRAEAEQPLALGVAQAKTASVLVFSAANSGHAEVLDAVLAAGSAVTLNAINRVAERAVRHNRRAPDALRLLLSRGRPPVPLDGAALPPLAHQGRPGFMVCPIYAVLQHFSHHLDKEADTALDEADRTKQYPLEDGLYDLHDRALAVVDCLADAGYRPSTFTNYPRLVGQQQPAFFPGGDQQLAQRWELSTSSRWLWLAAQREPWSPERHAAFPPAFKQAARALLLAAHRGAALSGAAGAGSGAAQLGRLPRELLHVILGHAAYPLSPWRPVMVGGRALEAVLDWDSEVLSEISGSESSDDDF